MKILLIFLGIVFTIIFLFLIIFDDVRMFIMLKINPASYKYKCIHKLVKNGEEVYIVGTFHHFHITSKEYSLLHIKAVIENLIPDLLLIESRQEEMDMGNIADGPVEMLYSHLVARSHAIMVKGIDWWSWDENKILLTYKKRDDIITENIVTNASGHKKVLVIMGAAHMAEEIPRLKKQGYVEYNLSKEEKEKLFIHTDGEIMFPKGTKQYYDIRIGREKTVLNNKLKNEKQIERQKKKINYLEMFRDNLKETV